MSMERSQLSHETATNVGGTRREEKKNRKQKNQLWDPQATLTRDSRIFSCSVSLIHRIVNMGVNRFGHTECLVTRAAFCSAVGKVGIIVINDPFIDLNYTVYMLQYDSTHGKLNGTIKSENVKLVINRKPITIFQERDPNNIKWGDADAE
ncbi:glyceraldehyde-3-phosphate dehydrogenase-like [Arvicanthis niloticus]|uniref:glyceraldehyde-3-phosphate dehydrogenase-like n=1 Tax=Arvicanthis niloticus TaxID=61156 RepID=UPI00402BD46C